MLPYLGVGFQENAGYAGKARLYLSVHHLHELTLDTAARLAVAVRPTLHPHVLKLNVFTRKCRCRQTVFHSSRCIAGRDKTLGCQLRTRRATLETSAIAISPHGDPLPGYLTLSFSQTNVHSRTCFFWDSNMRADYKVATAARVTGNVSALLISDGTHPLSES